MNGKKNGKAKEFFPWNGKLIWEGEYVNDKRYGKGKDYNGDGNIEFEGQYFDGSQWTGEGREKKKGKLLYKGGVLEGKKGGKEKEYYFANDNLEFDGKLYYTNGKLELEGEFRYNRKWNGKRYYENGNIIYEVIKGNGKVKEYEHFFGGKIKFEGEYLDGKKNEKGKEYWNCKFECEGEFLNDKRNGKGDEYDENGKVIFEGEYLNGNRNRN